MKILNYFILTVVSILVATNSNNTNASSPAKKTFLEPIEAYDFCTKVASSTEYCTITHTYVPKIDLDLWRADYLIKEHVNNQPSYQYRPFATYTDALIYCNNVSSEVISCTPQAKSTSTTNWGEAKYEDSTVSVCSKCSVEPPKKALPSDPD